MGNGRKLVRVWLQRPQLANLVYSFIMLFHGVSHARRVTASLHRTVVCRSFVVGLHVLPQIMLILEAEEQKQK